MSHQPVDYFTKTISFLWATKAPTTSKPVSFHSSIDQTSVYENEKVLGCFMLTFHGFSSWIKKYNILNSYSNVSYSKIKHDSVRDLDHHSCDPIIPHTLISQTIKRYITYILLKQIHIILTIRLVANYKFIYYLKTYHIYTVVNVVLQDL